jgi:hypothetical protein
MPRSQDPNRIYSQINELANIICTLQDAYATLYAVKKYNSRYILKELGKLYPEYSLKTINEMIKPIHQIKKKVNDGTWVPNTLRDQELITKLETILINLKPN